MTWRNMALGSLAGFLAAVAVVWGLGSLGIFFLAVGIGASLALKLRFGAVDEEDVTKTWVDAEGRRHKSARKIKIPKHPTGRRVATGLMYAGYGLAVLAFVVQMASFRERFQVPFPTGTGLSQSVRETGQSQPIQSESVSSEPETFEFLIQAKEGKVTVDVGPGIDWIIQSNKRFIAYSVADDSKAKGQEYEMQAGESGWGGDKRRGRLFVQGVENDTRIKFFKK